MKALHRGTQCLRYAQNYRVRYHKQLWYCLCIVCTLLITCYQPLMAETVSDTIYTERLDTTYFSHIDTIFTQHTDSFYHSWIDSTAYYQKQADYDNAKEEVVALKNNLAYDAILTPNLALEFRLHPHWSLEVGAGFNPFPLKDESFPKWRHVAAWIAPRYWFCNTFSKAFVSANVAYAHYNVAGDAWPISWLYDQVKEHRYQGDAVLFGISAGWHVAISPHFSIEFEVGADAGHTWYDRFECKHCGKMNIDERGKKWFALPKIGINLVVPLGGDKISFEKRCDCENIDMELPEVTDTTFVVVPDTIIPAPTIDTIVTVVRDTVITEREVKGIDTNSAAMKKLRAGVFRDDSEYAPYDINTALCSDPRNVFLHFETNVTVLDRNFIENAKTLDSIAYLIGDALEDSTLEITHIQIVGFASFDGRLAHNEKLAGGRAKAMKDFFQERYPELPDSIFAVCNGGESWAELRYYFEHDTFAEKQEVLDIIDNEPNLDKREAKIKKLYGGDTYRYIRREYKVQLRNLGCITVYVKVK